MSDPREGKAFGKMARNPGSPEAVDAGCTCAVMDNSYGKGRYCDGDKYGWWITAGCPLHAPTGEIA